MTRLFIRFYLGVVAVLVVAWLIQSWLSGERFAEQNTQAVRDALFGGVRNARDKYRWGLQRNFDEQLLANIQEQFAYPVNVQDVDPELDFDILLTNGLDTRFDLSRTSRGYIVARANAGRPEVLVFGPLPEFAQPTPIEVATGLGAVFLLAALAIAMLLRPVVKQFQSVESAAETIASGQLSTRIEGRGLRSSKLVTSFNNMAERTEAMVRTQDELLQAVSHELRTPLARIHFATDLIRTADDAERENKLVALESAADDLDKIVSELLSYVRMEHEVAKERAEIDIESTVRMLFEKQSILNRDIEFTFENSAFDGELTFTAEESGFVRVLRNLLSNAARHSAGKVAIQACSEPGFVVIDVDDNGSGIAESERNRVLDPFVRLDDSGAGTGVGLGLAIVKRIMENHDGTVSIDDSPLGGCRFRTRWPVS